MGRILPRHIAPAVEAALGDTRVVLVNGARQSGKSTLVAELAQRRGAEWFTFDDTATRRAAIDDPVQFVRLAPRMVIDEVQRVPGIFLDIKRLVDAEPRPGRFLLTGSSRVLALRGLPDALPGRMETIELWPLSQGEIEGRLDGFVHEAFELGPEIRHRSAETRASYIGRLVRGGFPEAVARSGRRRSRFLSSYVATIVDRDVIERSQIEHRSRMHALIRLLAARSGQLLVPNALSREIGLAQNTVRHYLGLLDEVFLIKRIPAWSRNLSARATSVPKVAFTDSGVAANVLGQDAESLHRLGGPLGPLLEGFVAMEIARQITWSDQEIEMSHYRTRDQVEVDIVLEDRRGRVVAIEVKAASTVGRDDFRGLRHLGDRLGDDLVAGFVLYLGEQTLPFGPRLLAMPVSALWEVAPQ